MEKSLKKLLFLSIFIINFLNADLAYLYRTQGIDAVKEKIEQQLKQKEYWEQYLDKKDVKFGYYESKQFIIYCEKQTKKLRLYKNENHKFLKLSDNNVIVGEKEGDKHIEGDLKTPEGAYDLTSKITKLDSFYGPLALVTSYPDNFDKSLKKKGHGIWIHGMPINEKREDYTKGCIALDNPALSELEKRIVFEKSILIISNKAVEDATKDELSSILSFIYSWKEAWKDSNFRTYLKYYSKEFRKANGASFDDFKTYKERLFLKKEEKKIKFSNINIMPYPNSINKRMFKIVMDEDYKTRSYNFNGKKELYIEIKKGEISILSEG